MEDDEELSAEDQELLNLVLAGVNLLPGRHIKSHQIEDGRYVVVAFHYDGKNITVSGIGAASGRTYHPALYDCLDNLLDAPEEVIKAWDDTIWKHMLDRVRKERAKNPKDRSDRPPSSCLVITDE